MDRFVGHTGTRHRFAILAAVCVAALALPLAFSGGAVATPAIGRALGSSANPTALNWITNAFMLSFGSLLMAAGTLADRYGRKRVFIWGLAAFVLCSLGLACAPTLLAVDLLRGVQGAAAAAALAGGTAALAQEFEGHARTRAFGTLGATFGLGLAFGPLIAGVLIEYASWRAIFVSGALTCILSLVFGARYLRESRDPHARGTDWPGTLTFTLALSSFTFGVIEAPLHGWTSSIVLTLLTASVVLASAFVVVESRSTKPMLDLSLFRYPRFVGVQVLPIATCYCYIVLLVVLPLRMIGVDGLREIDAGCLMIALSAPMLVVPFVAATLTRWLSMGVICAAGLVLAAVGLVWLAIALQAGPYAAMAPMILIGIGAALPWGLMDGLSVSVVPKERAGMATGIFSTTRVAGEGVALATVNAVLAVLTETHLAQRIPADRASLNEAAARLASGDLTQAAHWLPIASTTILQHAYADAFATVLKGLAAITLLCAAIILVFLGPRRRDTESETEHGTLARQRQRA
ncbi:MFS transporter [Paraburkholderia sp. Ac-20340]|uniref:MFS transporter n=1 Tax=Paraburkholderia sp. Ac-20340 TaxID=2703888 RepID=UPI00197FC52D|nr:MFS transporter [Paraburkholderia sp. Ac-20340]MBN3857033.1 MFS transporter [Paraburkholderia sp. Ac-20340]